MQLKKVSKQTTCKLEYLVWLVILVNLQSPIFHIIMCEDDNNLIELVEYLGGYGQVLPSKWGWCQYDRAPI